MQRRTIHRALRLVPRPADGQTSGRRHADIPIDATILAVAKGKSAADLSHGGVDGEQLPRAHRTPPVEFVVTCRRQRRASQRPRRRELFIVDITGRSNELRSLVRTLMLVAIGGLLLALGLGLFLARAALRPLEDVTNEIETVAETNDLGVPPRRRRRRRTGTTPTGLQPTARTVESSQILQRQLVLDASHELRTPLTSLRTNAQVLSRAKNSTPTTCDKSPTTWSPRSTNSPRWSPTSANSHAANERRGRSSRCDSTTVSTSASRPRAPTRASRTSRSTSTSRLRPCIGRRDRLDARHLESPHQRHQVHTPRRRDRVDTSTGVITVGDSGPGIADEDRPFIFDRFWRSPVARALPGRASVSRSSPRSSPNSVVPSASTATPNSAARVSPSRCRSANQRTRTT